MIEETAAQVRENVQKVIVGKSEVIELGLVAVLCEGHILVEDVPGIGKTTLARALARSLGCAFRLPPHPVHARSPPFGRHRH